jgi:hypothetical protein
MAPSRGISRQMGHAATVFSDSISAAVGKELAIFNTAKSAPKDAAEYSAASTFQLLKNEV